METIKNIIAATVAFLFQLCSSNVTGIDVSHRQGNIDWEQVANDKHKIQFVFVKATEGSTYIDEKCVANVSGARNAGLDVGIYHFFRMTSSPEKQFDNFKKRLSCCMSDLTLLPVVDVETFDGKTSSQVKKAVEKFVRMIYDEYGVYPVIYGPDIAPRKMLSDFVNRNCMFFIGQPGIVRPKQKHAICQYSCKGEVDGIKTKVDLDVLHKMVSIEDLRWKPL